MPEEVTQDTVVVREGSGKMILATVLLIALIFLVLWWSFMRYSVTGSIQSDGPTLGQWTVHPTVCTAQSTGEPKVFTFTSSGTPDWKLIASTQPTEAPGMEVYSSADQQMHMIDFDRCGKMDIKADVPSGASLLNGSVTLDCIVGDSHLTGHLDFQNCR